MPVVPGLGLCYNPPVKHVVSVSLGSSKRDKSAQVDLFGESFVIERRGTDGDLRKFAALFAELDGKVDALGIGGADMFLWIDQKRYVFREIQRLVSGAKTTPVVDGSGLKNTLERAAVAYLGEHKIAPFSQMKAFLVMAVDRFGMAQALGEVCKEVVYGDLMFGLGLPIPLRSYGSVAFFGKLTLPFVTRCPFKWFYPTGEKQEQYKPKCAKWFEWADLIAGDWHYIRRHMPRILPGKMVLTNTIRKADLELLRSAGIKSVVTTTPEVDGETFGTNVMEGVLVAMLGKRPEDLTPTDYLDALSKLNWKPNVMDLSPPAVIA